MDNTMPKSFDHKICRSCGQSFTGDRDICESCFEEFQSLEDILKQDEHLEHLSHCKYCGRPFIGGFVSKRGKSTFFQPTRSEYCKGINNSGVHFSQCQNCGEPVRNSIASGYPSKVGCSKKCVQEIKRPKQIATNMMRYGTPVPSQSEIVKERIKQHNREKFGADWYLSRESSGRAYADQRMREKYGVESNISQNHEIQQKIQQTFQLRYGGRLNGDTNFAERSKQVSLDKYGTEYPQQSQIVREKTQNTNLSKYGVPNVMQDIDIANKIRQSQQLRHANTIRDPQKRLNYLEFCKNPIEYVISNFDHKPTIYELQDSLAGFDLSTIYFYLGRNEYSHLLSKHQSQMEYEVQQFIESICHTSILQQSRSEISPYELDLYLPDYQFGIECNPTATHNSTIPFKLADISVTPTNYHKMKTDLCEQKGIFLFHIFGYEWAAKSEIIKSMIRNFLQVCDSRFYARNLSVRVVSGEDSELFLNINHRQGAMRSSVRLGLYTHDDELVSLMTFNKMRLSMGAKKDDSDNTWELSRFCSKLNTSVVGGASKLFNYFLRNYQYDKIISFSDRAHTRGAVYEKLGFRQISISEPNYVWVRLSDDVYFHRVTCQKKNLPRLFNELDLDIENQTEKQIMVSHGFVQVFDSGVIRWEYTNPELDAYP